MPSIAERALTRPDPAVAVEHARTPARPAAPAQPRPMSHDVQGPAFAPQVPYAPMPVQHMAPPQMPPAPMPYAPMPPAPMPAAPAYAGVTPAAPMHTRAAAAPTQAAPWPATAPTHAAPYPAYVAPAPASPRPAAEDASLASVFQAMRADRRAEPPAAAPQDGLHDLFLSLGR